MMDTGSARNEMAAARVETQARVCAAAVLNVLRRTLLEHRPADRCLRDEFYGNRQFGSRDRRLISETLFSLLRWWGWLWRLAPDDFTNAWRESLVGKTGFALPYGQECPFDMEAADWLPALAAAWLMENRTADLPEAVALWRRQCGLPRQILAGPSGETLAERRAFLSLWNDSLALSDEELLPDWFYASAGLQSSESKARVLEWQQRRAPVWLRAQISDPGWLAEQLRAAGLETERHPSMGYALRIKNGTANLRGLETFRNGDFEIQDISSQCVGLVCAPAPGEQWWDACAGGGGKTLQLAWMMAGKGSVLATDIRVHKLEELKLRARRAGFPNIRCKEWKGKPMPVFRDRFDGVLVDAPCSCSGTWRRNPGARWTTTLADVQECSLLQRQLLENASPAVRPGGTLVYATCSLLPSENQDVVSGFLAGHPEFALEPFVCPLTGEEVPGQTQLQPWMGDGDAMFIARFRKTNKTMQ